MKYVSFSSLTSDDIHVWQTLIFQSACLLLRVDDIVSARRVQGGGGPGPSNLGSGPGAGDGDQDDGGMQPEM